MFGRKNPVEEKPLNIFVVGCGKVGMGLIEALVKEGNNITLVDLNETKIREAAAQMDIMTVVGNGASYRVLVDAGITDADVFIAVTHSDELNLLCCSVASQVSTCNTIARVRTPDYSEEVWYLRDKLGLTMVINPDLEAATEITRILNLPSALEVNSVAKGEAQLIKYRVEEGGKLSGRSLLDVVNSVPVRMLFTAAERDGETFIPNGSYVFRPGDDISFVTSRRDRIPCLKALGLFQQPLKDALIIGGGRGSYYLAKHLLAVGMEVKIIEKDPIRCEELSLRLPKATIICGDGTDTDLVREEGLAYYEAFVPYTGIDESNVMLALYAQKYCDAKIITKISRAGFNSIIDDMDLGSVIYPWHITIDLILAYTRAKRVAVQDELETLYHMFDDRVEVLEFTITAESPVTGTPLCELSLQENVLVAYIFRNGKMFFPAGTDHIEVGDIVMIVTTNLGYNTITDILR